MDTPKLLPEDWCHPFALASPVPSGDQNAANAWILDSGASVSATNDASDCFDITNCNVSVTAAGSTFNVYQKGLE
jgi:hypothetical protein